MSLGRTKLQGRVGGRCRFFSVAAGHSGLHATHWGIKMVDGSFGVDMECICLAGGHVKVGGGRIDEKTIKRGTRGVLWRFGGVWRRTL